MCKNDTNYVCKKIFLKFVSLLERILNSLGEKILQTLPFLELFRIFLYPSTSRHSRTNSHLLNYNIFTSFDVPAIIA